MGRRCKRSHPHKRCERPSFAKICSTYLNGEKRSARKPFSHSRTYVPRKLRSYELYNEQIGIEAEEIVNSEVFYDFISGSSYMYQPKLTTAVPKDRKLKQRHFDTVDAAAPSGRRSVTARVAPVQSKGLVVTKSRSPETYSVLAASRRDKEKEAEGEEEDEEDEADGDEVDLIPDSIERAFDNSARHSVGMGLLSKIFGSGQATMVEGYNEDRSSRAFFTYWVSIVQIIVFIVVTATYGLAPYGTGTKTEHDFVLQTSQTIESVRRTVLTNFWVGPKYEDLIHNGARYSMCMRQDTNLKKVLLKDRQTENQTACCVQNDGSGCLQTSETDCDDLLSTWMKYGTQVNGETFVSRDQGGARKAGAVCGLDPAYCAKPSYSWPDDISDWPICVNASDSEVAAGDYHMKCEVLGRPCCVGIQGQCVLTTPEDCKFQGGTFHKEASLCSQVSCMEDVCGMIPFRNPDVPDQFYRLFSTIFLHAGLLDLAITVVVQALFMRDLEKLISPWRVVIIYVGSSICGSLASATFLPYYVEAGPSGGIYGMIAALYLELLRFERRVKNNAIWKVLLKMGASLIVLFFIGLFLPSIDNFAHFFGFLFGLLIAFALRPYEVMCNTKLEVWTRVIIGIVCGLLAAGLFAIFVLIFYVADQVHCDACVHLNCIPFTDTYCDSIKIRLRNE